MKKFKFILISLALTLSACAPSADIQVFSPSPGETIGVPLVLEGEARGGWYFEGSLSADVMNEKGIILASQILQADGDWMTNSLVPFKSEFKTLNWGTSESGKIVIHKANPSGLPENDESFEVPIKFPKL